MFPLYYIQTDGFNKHSIVTRRQNAKQTAEVKTDIAVNLFFLPEGIVPFCELDKCI